MVDTTYLLSLMAGSILNVQPIPFTPGFDIAKVAKLAESLPSHSWEYGATTQALLEFHDPLLSVFGPTPFPVQAYEKGSVKALAYAADKILLGVGVNGLADGDGAVGDPASLGVSAIMLGKTDLRFAAASRSTLDYLMNAAPRYFNGAISHRVATPELWADFMYMVPPFIAYYAADTRNGTLLQESVKQCGYYRQVLQSNTTHPHKGVWEHIIGPQTRDDGLWSTGNAWAAAGMARVLATVMRAPVAQNATWRQNAIDDLTWWITEILDGAMASSMDGGLVRNYMNKMDTTAGGFGEISGSALFAAVAYRMAVLQPKACGDKYINWAEGIRRTLGGRDTNGNPHITRGGVATPAVNPLGWLDPKPVTTGSPEGQAFVVLMYAAWRDCVLVDRCTWKLGSLRRMEKRMHRFGSHKHR
ncbi:hypothetical protein BDZ94DRAFT_1174858 [Collybia nuda]|uniref:Glycosyl hydrolase family 88 n=1 Tax=Collybia nuda TaxID=64659 RepID=A0A9P5XU79_9AGAR|nr:hypothetical protein BDZ94DRAFT_1174858 [Collybia nuda]